MTQNGHSYGAFQVSLFPVPSLPKKRRENVFLVGMTRHDRIREGGRSLAGNASRVRNIRHENPVMNEAFRRKMKQMREDLGSQSASALEKVLIERVVLCWFHLQDTEINYISHMKGSVTLEKATYLLKPLDRAEARYQAAIRSLAVVRRLQLSAVQVNIGENQINVAQVGTEGVSVLSEEKQELLT